MEYVCCGCPYGRECKKELEVLEEFEPKLAVAVKNVFKDSYKYTNMYHEFRNGMDNKSN